MEYLNWQPIFKKKTIWAQICVFWFGKNFCYTGKNYARAKRILRERQENIVWEEWKKLDIPKNELERFINIFLFAQKSFKECLIAPDDNLLFIVAMLGDPDGWPLYLNQYGIITSDFLNDFPNFERRHFLKAGTVLKWLLQNQTEITAKDCNDNDPYYHWG